MEKAKLGFIRFFTGYFKQFHKLILVNVLFSLPSAAIIAAVYLINTLTGLNNSFIAYLPIILCFPFLSGVAVVTRNIVRGDEDVAVYRTYIKAFKENFLRFLIHGAVYYLAFYLCYSSIALYLHLGKSNSFFYFPFGLAILIAVAALFSAYHIPTMSATFDLKLKSIYKNAALMSFGELKNNLLSTVGLFIYFLIFATVYLAVPPVLPRIIVTLLLAALTMPSTVLYIINFYCYKDMARTISREGAASAGVREEKEETEENLTLDFSDIDLDEKKDGEEYLFFNGKMIKRKTLIKMRDEQEKS